MIAGCSPDAAPFLWLRGRGWSHRRSHPPGLAANIATADIWHKGKILVGTKEMGKRIADEIEAVS